MDGNDKVGITFDFVNTVYDYVTYWNNKQGTESTNHNFIGNSNLNDCLQPSGYVYENMPSNLMIFIKTINKKVDIYQENEWIESHYYTKLFPLSYDEIDGNDDGTYEYYKVDSKNRRKKHKEYWLRSPDTSSNDAAWYVAMDGSLKCDHYGIVCIIEYPVSLAFCI